MHRIIFVGAPEVLSTNNLTYASIIGTLIATWAPAILLIVTAPVSQLPCLVTCFHEPDLHTNLLNFDGVTCAEVVNDMRHRWIEGHGVAERWCFRLYRTSKYRFYVLALLRKRFVS